MFIKKLHQQVICNHHEPVANTPLGQLRGVKTEDAYIFRGIKYANARRFHMPEPVESWDGIRDAIIYGFVCPEITTPVPHDQFTVPHVFYPQHEDCQYLNIWTQSLDSQAKRPVMVWLHGGGYSTGSGIEHYAYDGEELSRHQNVVVVTLNHRLNVLGYLDLSAYDEEYEQMPCGVQVCPVDHELCRALIKNKVQIQGTEKRDDKRRGKGDPGVNGGERGDLLVEVSVAQHPIFKRQDTDIFSTVPISFANAALGGPIRIRTVDGEVEFQVKPGTQTDTRIRLRGKGMPSLNSRGIRGDHYVTLVVQVPTKLTSEQAEALRAFDETMNGNTRNDGTNKKKKKKIFG